MIGVNVQPADRIVAQEFFEFCKTSWEFCQQGGSYSIILCSTEPEDVAGVRLVLIFSSHAVPNNGASGMEARLQPAGSVVSYAGSRLPIYGQLATFPGNRQGFLVEEKTRDSVILIQRRNDTTTIRIGYDIFAEIRHLLTEGQPVEHAGMPALELHVGLLRELITRAGFPFVEIPPVPQGHGFVACLTHDVDHPVLKNHFGDHTMVGFLSRATVGSLTDAFRGRIPFSQVGRNWAAAFRLPFIYLGLARDFWRDFERDYLELEAGRPSTFFFIPEAGNPGRRVGAPSQPRRACRYEVSELAPNLRRITAAGSGVALHGLDAWMDGDASRREKERVRQAAGTIENGVRMHWLYFNAQSPAILDEAGFTYDSTVGYNETVGFRAGTTQVYRPLEAQNLLELPLHVMDTALFYPSYLNLTEAAARERVGSLMDVFTRLGGAFTLNWHDRSLAPERLWGGFYRFLLDELTRRGAWFATASGAVAWFQMRRSAVVECTCFGVGEIKLKARATTLDSTLPGLKIRVHKPHLLARGEAFSSRPDEGFTDRPFNDLIDTTIKP